MKKLFMLFCFLCLAVFAHAKGWYTLNVDKARADLHQLMDTAFDKGSEAVDKCRDLAEKGQNQ
ncbi:MAG TPA: hypothetical protein VKX17_21070 [Planctomycetota bacterium]|nr:hypothetical protein [Planctomycetota bacterium]